MSENKATPIMMQMMRLQELSYKQQKEISSKLYDKAMNQQETTIENKYDSDRLFSLLESLPVPKQREYIEQIKASDPQVGQCIQQNFITIEQVPELEDELIQTAISSLNTETLLEAVIDLDQPVVSKLLSVRPKREQRLIRMELDQINDKHDWDTTQATSELMNAIRQTARQFNQ